MSDELDSFFDQVPDGWGLVPLNGQQQEPPEKPEPKNYSLVAGIPRPNYQKTPTRSQPKNFETRHIDARVEANRRRFVRDPAQLAWEREMDAVMMTKLVCGENGLYGIFPVAKVMEQMYRTMAGRTGGFARVDQILGRRALRTAAKVLHQGDVEWCIKLMAPIHSLLVRRPGPEAMYEFMAQVIRDLFPNAPDNYIEPARRVGHTPKRRAGVAEAKASVATKPKLMAPPDVEKIKVMDPERARMLLPHMYEALQGYEGDDLPAYQVALEALKLRAEIV